MGEVRMDMPGIRGLLLALALVFAARGWSVDEKASTGGFVEILPKQMEAVEKGEAWLAKNQQADGSWGNEGAGGGYRMAMTGLAGLALLSGGHTPGRGPYSKHL